jgi:hypothetical protein
MVLKETCQLVDVVYDPVPALQIAKNVERVKGEIVGRRKRGKTEAAYLTVHSPPPEIIHTRYGKESRCGIPKAEV